MVALHVDYFLYRQGGYFDEVNATMREAEEFCELGRGDAGNLATHEVVDDDGVACGTFNEDLAVGKEGDSEVDADVVDTFGRVGFKGGGIGGIGVDGDGADGVVVAIVPIEEMVAGKGRGGDSDVSALGIGAAA